MSIAIDFQSKHLILIYLLIGYNTLGARISAINY